MVGFTTHIRSNPEVPNGNGDTSDSDVFDDALHEAYNMMHLKWNEESQVVEKQKEIIASLLQDKTHLMLTISELKEEVVHFNSKLDGITKFVRMLNSRTESLSEILGVGKLSKYMNGIGYSRKSPNSKTMFVPYIQKNITHNVK